MPDARIRPQAAPDNGLNTQFRRTRQLSAGLVLPLSDADASVQSMADASPAKWHLAHTSWFFETFLLRDHLPGYRLFNDRWPFLFNSYYEAEGARINRGNRGLISRPSLAEVMEWREYVDHAMEPLLGNPALAGLVQLGIAHEQQHIELLLTDIKHALWKNPLGPAMWGNDREQSSAAQGEGGQQVGGWLAHPGGIALTGHRGAGFAFDNEGPPHRILLEPFALSRRLVTNGEWQQFIDDGGYRTASLWLSDGWACVQSKGIAAPLYWGKAEGCAEDDGDHFTHEGWQPRNPDAPVSHISYFEADAFASWAGARLPTEFEWEAIAGGQAKARGFDAAAGNQLDCAAPPLPAGTGELFGDCWQFTRSAYLPYPRFAPAAGAVGEYNGKFMAGQWVLKGASCATVRGHSRASYRNFFYPQQRWQFTGLRLAKDE